MPFHIKNPETDALARRLAGLKKMGLTEAVHLALAAELERMLSERSLPELAAGFCRDLAREAEAARARAPSGVSDASQTLHEHGARPTR